MNAPRTKREQVKQPRHYGDVGEALTGAPWQPRAVRKDIEEELRVLFHSVLHRDYGGHLDSAETP